MPIKKSELYSSLWQSCDELRGGRLQLAILVLPSQWCLVGLVVPVTAGALVGLDLAGKTLQVAWKQIVTKQCCGAR